MTVKAKKASLRTAGCRAGLALLCLLPAVAVAKDGPYLTWRAKTAPVQQTDARVQAPQVPVPPSPYGQVGDPYVHVLTWNTKAGAAPQTAMASAAPMRRAPVQQEMATYAPAPQAPAEPPQRSPQAYRMQAPQYRAQPMASTLPEPAPDVSEAAEPPMTRQTLPSVAAQTAQPARPAVRPQAPAPRPVQALSPAPAPAPTPANDGAYQVPATSPYAARIARARAQTHAQTPAKNPAPAPAQSQAQVQAQAQAQAKTTAAPARPAQAAPQPTDAPITETASDDKPFVPGQHYTDASEAPRLYSLHRDYGLKPDPITVDTDATGAVLDTSKLDAAEAKALKDEKADEDTAGDDPDADGVPNKAAKPSKVAQ
jgi:hypothetical protein